MEINIKEKRKYIKTNFEIEEIYINKIKNLKEINGMSQKTIINYLLNKRFQKIEEMELRK